jgi:hypothetical protein
MEKVPIAVKAFHGQEKTLFYSEGSHIALLITHESSEMKGDPLPMQTAEAALAWCKTNNARFIYLPHHPAHN